MSLWFDWTGIQAHNLWHKRSPTVNIMIKRKNATVHTHSILFIVLPRYPTQSHYPDTELTSYCLILIMPKARIGSNEYKLCKSLVWVDQEPNSNFPHRNPALYRLGHHVWYYICACLCVLYVGLGKGCVWSCASVGVYNRLLLFYILATCWVISGLLTDG